MNRHERRRNAVLDAKRRGTGAGTAVEPARSRRGEDPVPASVRAANERGIRLHERGEFEAAIRVFLDAAAIEPDFAATHSNLGSTFQAVGKLDLAVLCCRAALHLDPGFAAAWSNLGNALYAQGRYDEAVEHYRHAARLDPNSAEVLTNLGSALQVQGKLQEAIESYGRAIEINPSYAAAHNNLGTILRALGRVDDAVASFERATARAPLVEAHHNLAEALQTQGRREASIASHRRANELRYDPAREIAIATVLPAIPASRDAITADRQRLAANLQALAGSELPRVEFDAPPPIVANFFLAYHGQNDVDLQRTMAAVCLKMSPSLAYTAPHCRTPIPSHGRRLRVGVVSGYVADHTVEKLTRGLIERLARDRFEVVAFTVRGLSDELAPTSATAADRAVRLPKNLSEARRRIEAETLDVLLYPDIGMDRLPYFLAYARLAPVQCVTWGHPVTTGIPNIDYFVSSASLEPDGAEAHYSERLVRLSRLPTYYYRPETPARTADRREFGFDDGDVLYVCPQSLFKLHPDFDEIVADLLRRDPRGRLVLIEGLSQHWQRGWWARVSPLVRDADVRIRFVPRLSLERYLGLLRIADVILDPVHFGGGNSTYEALALGVPIVTWPGELMRGRVTAACYHQIGVMDCVVDSADAYVERAVRLANDRDFRDDISARILAGSARLFEDGQVVEEFQTFFEEAVAAASRRERL